MALALVPLVVTLTFGMPPGSRTQEPSSPPVAPAAKAGYLDSFQAALDPPAVGICGSSMSPLDVQPADELRPRWPGNIHIGVEREDWVVVFVGARFVESTYLIAEIKDGDGPATRVAATIGADGWAAFQPLVSLIPGHLYRMSLMLMNDGATSIGRPSVSFVMPPLERMLGTGVVIVTRGNPPMPFLWRPGFVEKLLFFVVDPFVLAFMATGAILRRRQRRLLLRFLA